MLVLAGDRVTKLVSERLLLVAMLCVCVCVCMYILPSQYLLNEQSRRKRMNDNQVDGNEVKLNHCFAKQVMFVWLTKVCVCVCVCVRV